MDPRKPLYRVSVNTSGLIFAVVVGLWAAYLVPMWLRRQDELNEARPTERFTTAIRLLSGRAGLERRTERETERRRKEAAGRDEEADEPLVDAASADPDSVPDLRGFAAPVTEIRPLSAAEPPAPAEAAAPQHAAATSAPAATRVRARVLARRRRTTMALFLAFALSGIVTMAAGRGLALLWVPAVPGVLLSVYIVHLRKQERRRYAINMDRRRAEEAARQLRMRSRPEPVPAAPEPASPAAEAVEEADHAEWVDQQRHRAAAPEEPDGWEPAPVPLPTYVNAPVAPRSNRGVDLDAPDTWSAARSTTAGAPQAPRPQRTPLFDQYAEDARRRAAGE